MAPTLRPHYEGWLALPADLRRELLDEAERYHGREIESALAMLRSAAEKSPLLARALSRAEG